MAEKIICSYTLFYKKIALAKVTCNDTDFFNNWGKYELNEDVIQIHSHLRDYIHFSMAASKLMEEDETKWDEFCSLEEPKYLDLIDSEDWTLVDSKGESNPIVIPGFCVNDELVWRWDHR